MKILKKIEFYIKLSMFRQNQGHTNVATQFFEMAVLFALRGIGPGYYHSAQLWRNDMKWKDKLGWMSEAKYRKRVYQYNPRPYQKISQNKLPEKGLLTLFDVPTAEFFGFYHPLHGRDVQGNSFCNGKDVLRLLDQKKIGKFCIKEMEGWGGRGFEAFEVIREKGGTKLRTIQGGQAVLVEEFFHKMPCLKEGLAFEAYIEQHPIMRSLNPSSLNTIRVLVVWPYEEESPHIAGAFVRIGRAGSLVDNTSAGGLAALVDRDTGEVGPAHYKPPHPDVLPAHPDHGAQIEGLVVPFWENAKELVKKTMPIFPHIRFCGFDVAISVDGPMIVELNVEPDKSGLMQINVSIEKILPK